MEKNGNFLFILHSHIPYVLKHGEWPHGEYWLFEATAETYIPLLQMLERFKDKGIKPKITLGLTPVLIEQLKSDYFKEKFNKYLEFKIELLQKDKKEFERKNQNEYTMLALFWEKFYTDIQHLFNITYKKDIINRFKYFLDKGYIEILTSAATHGYLPLLGYDNNVRAQIKAGIDTYVKYFGKKPKGIWMPECAYRPKGLWKNPITKEVFIRKGVDEILVEEGIEYTFIDSPNLENASLFNQYGEKSLNPLGFEYKKTPYIPYKLASGLTLFVRDHITGYQVWSKHYGYPGDPFYLEFHKQKDTSGIKYWRITGANLDLAFKEIYSPDKAKERVNENAMHFAELITQILKKFKSETGLNGVLVAPFDAELFGHWWFEGPKWLEKVIENLKKIDGVEPATGIDILKNSPKTETITLKEGSWGENNDHSVWFNENTKWTWEKLYNTEKNFLAFLKKHKRKALLEKTLNKILKEAAKSLIIAEASDWQFLIHTQSGVDYVEERFNKHIGEVEKLISIAKNYLHQNTLSDEEKAFIEKVSRENIVFNNICLEWYLED
ncbi:1,4-alpha-glucan branching enzyme [Thermotomaculum hydrothermale]|uniref:1,4-alpha-glucan branching enzyme n=1 Tax=Thermotomaculum hydrothermale TaxID=981385 RepID=A0A7R6PKH6_9BACT|nr:1,4-alpha-glucan branching protein domain-containing protein [Thermotomaculum hydrothermale]BBB31822.1 1,4-alpha-glucan branching enzyme [Thermotomaculum hydrothermale]